jgi:hypothetical protein
MNTTGIQDTQPIIPPETNSTTQGRTLREKIVAFAKKIFNSLCIGIKKIELFFVEKKIEYYKNRQATVNSKVSKLEDDQIVNKANLKRAGQLASKITLILEDLYDKRNDLEDAIRALKPQLRLLDDEYDVWKTTKQD